MLNDADANHQADDTTEKKLENRFYNRYYTLLNSLHDAVFVHDFEGNHLEVNSQAVDQLGYSREELLNMGLQDIDSPEFADLIEPRIQKIVENGHLVFETAHITKDGQKIPIELSSTVVEYDGEPVIISVARDISKRKKAEKKLEESKNRLSLVIEGSGLGTWDWNVQTGDVIFNERWANMLGYELSEIEPSLDAWKKRVHPEDLPEVMEILNEHLEGKSDSYVSEHRMRTKNGDWVWIEDRGRVVERDEDGDPIRATGTHLDITERKQAQKALQAERKQLLEIFDSIDEIVYVVDPESNEVLFVNEYMRT
ncbi:MAG: PAS domain S-box protein, partial [Candidatus Thorarchaeota archaeon]|nr:PAS domain S-box protein [Candidatus Thorarchaeota archaeon]